MPGVAAGLLLGFTLPLLMNPAGWSDYFSAMQIHTLLYRTGVHFPPTPQSLPPTIDGMPTPLIGGFVPIHSHDFSGYFFLRQLSSTAISELLMTLTLVVPFVFWLWWTRRESTSRLLPAMAAWFFLIDLFVPAPRYSYYDVIILNVVFAGVVTTGKIPWAVWPCVVGTLLGWAVYFLQPNRPLWIVLPEDFFTMGVVLFLFTPPKPKEDATGPMAGHPSPATP